MSFGELPLNQDNGAAGNRDSFTKSVAELTFTAVQKPSGEMP